MSKRKDKRPSAEDFKLASLVRIAESKNVVPSAVRRLISRREKTIQGSKLTR